MTTCHMKISDCLCKRLVLRPAKSSMKVLSVPVRPLSKIGVSSPTVRSNLPCDGCRPLIDRLGRRLITNACQETRLRWTDDDVRRLRLFADANVTADTIAKSLGRTRPSVKLKAHRLNLSLTQKAQPSPRRQREVAGRSAGGLSFDG